MKNFDYLQQCGMLRLHSLCAASEDNQVNNPELSAISARRALEYVVKSLYAMKGAQVPERSSLFELIDGEPFSDFIGDNRVMMAVHYVRKVGNAAAHNDHVGKRESFFCLLNLYNVVAAVLLKLKVVESVAPFDKALIPDSKFAPVVTDAKIVVNESDEFAAKADAKSLESAEPVREIPSQMSEAETRKAFIDLMLREAGWTVLEREGYIEPSKACIEIEVQGMPNAQGVGYADYVLFGANGLPLAVVEAKKSSASPLKGKHQAELYADCLEKRYGRRPVIYYTNGFETNIIDGLGYPPRKLYAFHTREDLERLIQKRGRKNIYRKGLLVMATGTGKTRVAISLVDVLKRNDWVKNVLFLADRTSLVSQAHKNFVKLLPNETTAVLNEDGDIDMNARIVFSTYQTMIGYIDTEEKTFSVGHFDLIIIDEAHRSIFGKFAAIFNYFDSLLIGLTATPRDEVDKSTYDIFEMDEGEPNYAYELEEAVADGYLVNYRGFKRGSKILNEGIRYSELSEQEREQLEKVWDYEDTLNSLNSQVNGRGRDILSNEMFKYIYNEDTVDKVLQDLMENGLKVQSGERIGKSIIFAYNHKHAELILNRFNVLYPEYGPDFCALIDNYVTYAKSLIEKFEIRDKAPQIAVSVDMLDTGIDVPDVLNLVFFKPVKSKIKFMQMVGRGTRLSQNVFGAGKDKECFYIFDWCGNFDFFEQNPDGGKVSQSISLTERLFGLLAEVAFYLQHQQYQEDEVAKRLHDDLKATMKSQVLALSDSHISVRTNWEAVSHFKADEAWVYISDVDVLTLKNTIAKLLPGNTLDENAKKFDVLILAIELGMVCKEFDSSRAIVNVQNIADKLKSMGSIPQVAAKTKTLNEVLNPAAWESCSLGWLEKVREDLRDLVKFLVGNKGKTFTIDIEDVMTDGGEAAGIDMQVSYRKKVMDYLLENKHSPVLEKIYHLEQLSTDDILELERILWEELGDKSDYEAFVEGKNCGENVAILIRSLIGVDREIALQRFNQFLDGNSLNSDQQEFLNQILDYVCENGDITTMTVVNDYPFDENLQVFNDKMIPLRKYIENVHNVVNPPMQG